MGGIAMGEALIYQEYNPEELKHCEPGVKSL
jgi:hypothetical protein